MSRDYVLQPFRAPATFEIAYERELNAQQLAAVTAPVGPALVIAGAGAGKTRTLVYRVAYLIEQGIPPEQILLLTFTNKAAREMMRRVSELLTRDLTRLWGGTFHSVGNRVLRRHADRMGYRPDFTILDREDARDLVSACLGEAEIDVKATRFPKADVLGDIFSLAVNTGQTLGRILERQFEYFVPLLEPIEDLQRRYAARKQAANVMDFDDLLVLWGRLLETHAEVREHYQGRFAAILVDEYQDTNRLQGDIVDLLAAGHHNVMAVGDDSQSIYSWRGADFRNIMRFPERHPGTVVYRIETNYRSTPEILTLANAAIATNVHQYEKRLAPVRPAGSRPARVACHDAHVQAAFVAQRVLELRDEGTALDDMAVLYRSHFHALELQMELTRRNIPFSITSGMRFFEQAHVKDVAAYLKLVCNPRDETAFKRLVRMLPGIGPKAADTLWKAFPKGSVPDFVNSPTGSPGADGSSVDAVEAIWNPDAEAAPASGASDPADLVAGNGLGTPETAPLARPGELGAERATSHALATALQSLADTAPKKARTAWAQFTATVSQLEAAPTRQSAAAMMALVLEAVYEEYLKATYSNYSNRLEDLEQLGGFAQQFTSPEEFLAQLALLTNVEAEAEAAPAAAEERLRLSTIHQAKGLEFGVVFVIMLCEGMFPSARSLKDQENEEEERRLFYVAVTRAKNELYLSYPLIRTAGSYGGDALQRRSRFLDELPEELVEEWSLQAPSRAI